MTFFSRTDVFVVVNTFHVIVSCGFEKLMGYFEYRLFNRLNWRKKGNNLPFFCFVIVNIFQCYFEIAACAGYRNRWNCQIISTNWSTTKNGVRECHLNVMYVVYVSPVHSRIDIQLSNAYAHTNTGQYSWTREYKNFNALKIAKCVTNWNATPFVHDCLHVKAIDITVYSLTVFCFKEHIKLHGFIFISRCISVCMYFWSNASFDVCFYLTNQTKHNKTGKQKRQMRNGRMHYFPPGYKKCCPCTYMFK